MSGLGNGHATLRSLLSNAKKFKGGFIRRTRTRIPEEVASAINQVHTLVSYFSLHIGTNSDALRPPLSCYIHFTNPVVGSLGQLPP